MVCISYTQDIPLFSSTLTPYHNLIYEKHCSHKLLYQNVPIINEQKHKKKTQKSSKLY